MNEDGLGKIDEIEVKYSRQGKRYADWQKEQYPVTTEARSGDYKKKISMEEPEYDRSTKWVFRWSGVRHIKRKRH